MYSLRTCGVFGEGGIDKCGVDYDRFIDIFMDGNELGHDGAVDANKVGFQVLKMLEKLKRHNKKLSNK